MIGRPPAAWVGQGDDEAPEPDRIGGGGASESDAVGQLDLEAEAGGASSGDGVESRRIGTNKGGSDGAVTGVAASRRLQA